MATVGMRARSLSLVRLLDPAVLADPYPLYRRLREEDPVHWDPYLAAWVVTRYRDVLYVLQRFSADRTPTPEQLSAMGLEELNPAARLMVRQMLFLDPPAHRRCAARRARVHARAGSSSSAITSRRSPTGSSTPSSPPGQMDVIADFAIPLPAIVAAEMLGVPTEDYGQLQALVGATSRRSSATSSTTRTTCPACSPRSTSLTAYFRDAARAATASSEREGSSARCSTPRSTATASPRTR